MLYTFFSVFLFLLFPIQASELEDEAQAQVARLRSEAHEARNERDEALKALHAAEISATKHENEVHSLCDALFGSRNDIFLSYRKCARRLAPL